MLLLLCFLGCPLMMGVMMFMMRDRNGAKLERDVRRLNAEAARLRASTTVTSDAVERPEAPDRAGESAQPAAVAASRPPLAK